VSAWRRKAIALFPTLRADLNAPDYDLFRLYFDLYVAVSKAHRDPTGSSDALLQAAHGYAEWCMHEGGDLWRRAAIGFYEDLFNGSGLPWDLLVPWISPYAAEQIEDTWALGIGGERAPEFHEQLRMRTREAYRTHVYATGAIEAL